VSQGAAVGVLSSIAEVVDPEPESASEVAPKDLTLPELQETVNLSHLPVEQQVQVGEILLAHKGVLSKGDDDIGRVNTRPHHIDLYDYTPIYQRPRRFPAPVAHEIEQQCIGLQNLGIIEESASPWSSPVVPIRKKDGTIRLCVDYRALNRVTKPDKFPMPNLSDSIFGLHGVKYFTRLDLVRVFYQVPLDEDSKELTAFSTPHGHWHFNRLSFGLKNAPSAFQRGMQEVLQNFPWKKVVIYIDDILIMESSFHAHLALVGQVLHTLEKHGIKVKPSKCEWFKSEVEFLGHVVSSRGVSKTRNYIDKVNDFPKPETVRQLREFLGLINFQRKFLQHCSEIQKPLSALTGGAKTKKLIWTTEMLEAFERLKEVMSQNIELAFPDYGPTAEKLELWVDASHRGAGACLTQVQEGELRIIAFASTTFNKAQSNYSILEKELAAMRWGIKNFRSFLYGAEFVLRTDHQPLVYLHNMRLVDSRLARTLEDLADFHFTIRFTPGHLNAAADALSRLKPILEAVDQDPDLEHGMPPGLTADGAPVPGGPNSLFLALHRALLRVTDDPGDLPCDHGALRRLLVDELLQHSSKYNIKIDKHIRRDLQIIRHEDQLPSIEVLLAASGCFAVKIFVYYWKSNPIVFQVPQKNGAFPTRVIHLHCLGGIHFDPLVETCEYKELSFSSFVAPCMVELTTSGEVLSESWEDGLDVAEEPKLGLLDCQHASCDQPRIKIKLGKGTYCAILDTGAEISLITKSALDKENISLVLQEEKLEIQGITLKRESAVGCIQLEFHVDSNNDKYQGEFAVLASDALPCCMLLGIDFLTKYGANIEFNHKLCKLSTGAVLHFLKHSVGGVSFVGTATASSLNDVCVGTTPTGVQFSLSWNEGELTASSGLFQLDDLLSLQKGDYKLRGLSRLLKNDVPKSRWPRYLSDFKKYAGDLLMLDGLIYYDSRSHCNTAVIPFNLLVEVALVFHHRLSHVGRDKILDLLRRQVWHPKVNKVVSDVCMTCKQCQLLKSNPLKTLPPMLKITTESPCELVAADLVEFGRTASGNVGCLMVVDHHTKWVAAVPIRNKTAAVVSKAFEATVLPYLPAIPLKVLTDNGPEFRSSLFQDVLDKYNIQHVFTTPYKPSSNGAVERVNRTIGSFLSSLRSESNQWDMLLPKAVITYNHTMHRELGMSPAEYLLSKPHKSKPFSGVPKEIHESWRTGHPRFVPFKIDDLVVRRVPMKGNLNSNKFSPKFDGPYKIVVVAQNRVTFKIQLLSDHTKTLNAHYEQLRPWINVPNYILSHPYYAVLCQEGEMRFEAELDDAVSLRSQSGSVRESSNLCEYYNNFHFSDTDADSGDSGSEYSEAGVRGVRGGGDWSDLGELFPSILYPKYDTPDVSVPKISETVLGSSRRNTLPSGCVLTALDETWNMSSIDDITIGPDALEPELLDAPVASKPLIDDLSDVNMDKFGSTMDDMFEAAGQVLNHMSSFVDECCDIVSNSFAGFDLEIQDTVAKTVCPLKNKLLIIQRCISDELAKPPDEDFLSPNITLNSGRNTRSSGPAPDHPHVQPTILERMKKL
jgi:hypothetical protein